MIVACLLPTILRKDYNIIEDMLYSKMEMEMIICVGGARSNVYPPYPVFRLEKRP